jgi:hypothetical protein
MVEEITGPAYDPLGRLGQADRAKARRAGGSARTRRRGQPGRTDGAEELPSEIQSLIDRVRHGEVHRLERVHEVLEKLQRGDLVNSETVRRAAERILRGGV